MGAQVDSQVEASSASSDNASDNLPEADDALPDAVVTFLKRKGRHAMFKASKTGSIEVDEVPGGRSLMDYMSVRSHSQPGKEKGREVLLDLGGKFRGNRRESHPNKCIN